MEKYHGFDQTFYEYLFDKVITDGGLRLQIIASDLGLSIDIQSMNFSQNTPPKIHSTYTENNMATFLKH